MRLPLLHASVGQREVGFQKLKRQRKENSKHSKSDKRATVRIQIIKKYSHIMFECVSCYVIICYTLYLFFASVIKT